MSPHLFLRAFFLVLLVLAIGVLAIRIPRFFATPLSFVAPTIDARPNTTAKPDDETLTPVATFPLLFRSGVYARLSRPERVTGEVTSCVPSQTHHVFERDRPLTLKAVFCFGVEEEGAAGTTFRTYIFRPLHTDDVVREVPTEGYRFTVKTPTDCRVYQGERASLCFAEQELFDPFEFFSDFWNTRAIPACVDAPTTTCQP